MAPRAIAGVHALRLEAGPAWQATPACPTPVFARESLHAIEDRFTK